MVTEKELEQLLQEHGWYLAMVVKRTPGVRYAYAKRREGQTVKSRYLIAESRLNALTEDEVLKRIQS